MRRLQQAHSETTTTARRKTQLHAVKVYFKKQPHPYDEVQKDLVYLLVDEAYEGENPTEIKPLQSTQPLPNDVQVKLLYNESVTEAKGGRTLLTKEWW